MELSNNGVAMTAECMKVLSHDLGVDLRLHRTSMTSDSTDLSASLSLSFSLVLPGSEWQCQSRSLPV